MRANIYIVLFLLSSLLVSSCKEERIMFDEAPSVYFLKLGILNPDSLIHSFGIRPAEYVKDTVFLTMKIMGNAMDRDREVKLDLLPGSTAKPGYHYIMGPLIMPAHQFQTKIPVYLFRRPGMKDSVIVAKFKIAESKDFKIGYTDKDYVTSRQDYKISIDDQILKPSTWDLGLKPYFGEFSVVKFRFMIETTGKIIWTGVLGVGERTFYISDLKAALYNYEKAYGPMLDENGNRVVFP